MHVFTSSYLRLQNLVHVFINIYYVFICTCTSYFCLWTYMCATLYRFLKSVKVLFFSLPVPVLLSVYLPLLVWRFNFTKKSDNEDLVLYVVSIITVLVKLLQMIWSYITSFVVCHSLCLSIWLHLWKICISWCYVA